jgi:hypothetical protein
MEFFDFGRRVDAVVPADADTFDLNQALEDATETRWVTVGPAIE